MTNGTTDSDLCFGDDRLMGWGPTSETSYPRPNDLTGSSHAKFDFGYNRMTGVGCVSDPRQDTASRASVREFVDDLLIGVGPASSVSRHRPGDSSQASRAAQHSHMSQVRKTGQGTVNPAIPTTQSAQTAQVASAPTYYYWGPDLGWKLPAEEQQSTSVSVVAGGGLLVDVGKGNVGCTDTEQYSPELTFQIQPVELHATSTCPLGLGVGYDLRPMESAERSTMSQTSSGFQK